jgi:hypothetical protein
MLVIKKFTASIAASLLLGAVAHASDAPNGHYGSARNSEAVMATTLPWNVQTIQRVSPTSAFHFADLDRSSIVGTGTAAAFEGRGERFENVSSVTFHYPEAQWSASIGMGTAAALER